MRLVQNLGAPTAPPTIIIQAEHVRRRISASDSVAALVAELAFGPTRRSDLMTLASVTSARIVSSVGAL